MAITKDERETETHDKYGFTKVENGRCVVCNYPVKDGEYCLQCDYTDSLIKYKIIGLT